MPDLLTSKKFQAALIGLIVVIAQHFIPVLNDIDLVALLAPIVAYILGQGLADLGKERALMEAAAMRMNLPEISGEIEIEEREWPSNRPT